MMKLLSDFVVGETGTITKVNGEGRIRRRLFDMGITPGAVVEMKKKAPFGDPIDFIVRGYNLTLRKAEAACVEVEVENIAGDEEGKERTAELSKDPD